MATKNDRRLLFLLSAVLVADAGADGVSASKRRVMNLHLRQRFPGLDLAGRWALVGRALRGMPEISDGVAFLSLVEKQSHKLAQELDEAEQRELMLMLLDVGIADKPVPETVERVLRTTARPLGFADTLRMPA
ncbi:MAG: hypothetical protein ACI8RZ_007455 [Myxococcota bacterium]|jgi:hypothetical protein